MRNITTKATHRIRFCDLGEDESKQAGQASDYNASTPNKCL